MTVKRGYSDTRQASSHGFFRGGPGHVGMPGEKPKNFKAAFHQLIRYLAPQRALIFWVFGMGIISTVFSIVSPKILGQAATLIYAGLTAKTAASMSEGIDFHQLQQYMLILIGLFILSSVFWYAQQYLMAGVAQEIVYDLRQAVSAKLPRLPLPYFDTRTHGEIMSRVTNDIDTIGTTLQQSLMQLISALCTILGIVIMMLTISPLLTLVTVITIPISVVVTIAVAKRSQPHFIAQQKTLGELNGHVEEMLTGHKIVKAFGREAESIREFEALNQQLYESAWKANFISGIIMPAMGLIGNFGYVIVCVVGSLLVSRGAIAIGDILAFIQYSRQFTWPITQTATIANVIQSTIAAAERVFELLAEPEASAEPETDPGAAHSQGAIVLENVSFGYTPEHRLFDHLNLRILPGQTVAIVGPTGAGKTTLVNLLMRFYDISEGAILLDGININQRPRAAVRKQFGMVLQDTWLFNGTIRDNIAYGAEQATDDAVIRAAKAAHADHFIRTLPDGYQTCLSDDAANLSQGQKQLLTIARAILADPPMLILDEATSSVDTRTEIAIQKAMNAIMVGRTSFVIAHRLSTIRNADLILVIDHGKIVETGTHAALMAANGSYANLFNSQFGNAPVQLNA